MKTTTITIVEQTHATNAFNYDQYTRMSAVEKLAIADGIYNQLAKYGYTDEFISRKMRIIGIHRSIIFKCLQMQKQKRVQCLSETPAQMQQEHSYCVETTTQNS